MPPLQTARAALLPFTGEAARRADEGPRAQRSAAFDFASGGSEQVRHASIAPSSGARTNITSGSLNASGSSSADTIGLQLPNIGTAAFWDRGKAVKKKGGAGTLNK